MKSKKIEFFVVLLFVFSLKNSNNNRTYSAVILRCNFSLIFAFNDFEFIKIKKILFNLFFNYLFNWLFDKLRFDFAIWKPKTFGYINVIFFYNISFNCCVIKRHKLTKTKIIKFFFEIDFDVSNLFFSLFFLICVFVLKI